VPTTLDGAQALVRFLQEEGDDGDAGRGLASLAQGLERLAETPSAA